MRQKLRPGILTSAMAMALMISFAARAETSTLLGAGTTGSETQTDMPAGPAYSLHLHHLHTGETLNVTYRIGNIYIPQALAKLNFFLRDHRTMDVTEYDPREFDLLHSMMAKLGRTNDLIDIVCGYRTPESNNFLRTRRAVTGVAEHSQHMEGRAIDMKVPGVRTVTLRNAALSMEAGGVGYYPSGNFVHVDVGPVREWQFGGYKHHIPHVKDARSHQHLHLRHHRA